MPSSDRMCCEYVAAYGCVRVLANVVVAVMVAVRDAGGPSTSQTWSPTRLSPMPPTISCPGFAGVGMAWINVHIWPGDSAPR